MSLSDQDAGLIVFLRLPQSGKVKTRLAASVGDDEALIIYQKLVDITLENVQRTDLSVFLFYEGGLPEGPDKDPAFSYHQQSTGDLGQKMLHAISLILQTYRKAIIIGSDCPALTPEIISEASLILENHDVVLGPAQDGGYYLLGCKKAFPFLFETIAWSTQAVFTQTMEAIQKYHLSSALLPILNDIDTIDDWISFSAK